MGWRIETPNLIAALHSEEGDVGVRPEGVLACGLLMSVLEICCQSLTTLVSLRLDFESRQTSTRN